MVLSAVLAAAAAAAAAAGFGDSEKPLPSAEVGPRGHFYNYDTWSQQIRDFVNEVGSWWA
jgi:hypothetical protein